MYRFRHNHTWKPRHVVIQFLLHLVKVIFPSYWISTLYHKQPWSLLTIYDTYKYSNEYLFYKSTVSAMTRYIPEAIATDIVKMIAEGDVCNMYDGDLMGDITQPIQTEWIRKHKLKEKKQRDPFRYYDVIPFLNILLEKQPRYMSGTHLFELHCMFRTLVRHSRLHLIVAEQIDNPLDKFGWLFYHDPETKQNMVQALCRKGAIGSPETVNTLIAYHVLAHSSALKLLFYEFDNEYYFCVVHNSINYSIKRITVYSWY
jgi:hypothetical protein